MTELTRKLEGDKELQELKKQYKEIFGLPAPGFNFDEYYYITDYKESIRRKIEEANGTAR